MSQAKKTFDFEAVEVGEQLGSFEYVLTQAQVDQYRRAVDDPDAAFTTLAVKHDAAALSAIYAGAGGVNARNEVHFFNPPVPGKRIKVTGKVVDKYVRRDLPYLVVEATAEDEDGRPIEKIRTFLLQRTLRVGEKWSARE
jgi:hypothetical protein